MVRRAGNKSIRLATKSVRIRSLISHIAAVPGFAGLLAYTLPDDCIPFPLEIRVGAADDVWLSTAYQRDSAYIAVHQYHRRPFAEYFLGVEQLLTRRVVGRTGESCTP